MKKLLFAMATLFLLTVSLSAQSNLTINLLEFKSSVDYVPFVGPAPVDLDYNLFSAKLDAETKIGTSKILSSSTLVTATGTEGYLGNNDKLQIKFKGNTYSTPYFVDKFAVTPFLVGGYTDETSDRVDASILLQRSKLIKGSSLSGMPDIDLVSIQTKSVYTVGKISIIANQNNHDGTYTYYAVRFAK